MILSIQYVLLDWKSEIPLPIFDQDQSLVDLYVRTWEIAYTRIKEAPSAPQSPYMDEACYENSIWIWDTCFMALFTRYSRRVFPGLESLINLYAPIHDGEHVPFLVWIPDNPPLFSWAELENFQLSGDLDHLKKLLYKDQYLQKHYKFFETVHQGYSASWVGLATTLKYRENLGFEWDGQHSGMDNTPRNKKGQQLFIDAVSQHALNALLISRLFAVFNDTQNASFYSNEHLKWKQIIQDNYWDEKQGMFVDISANDLKKSDVLSIASFWPLLAEVATQEQAEKIAESLANRSRFGGDVPFVSLSRSDPDFDDQTGEYWRGAVWLPTAYMGIKGLQKYSLFKQADEAAFTILNWMNTAYKTVDPPTIWECYSPVEPAPSTEYGDRVRMDFCGWSALGPINLFIENVLGFRSVDAFKNEVVWDVIQSGRLGISNFRFGEIVADFVTDGNAKFNVTSTGAFTLILNGSRIDIEEGDNSF